MAKRSAEKPRTPDRDLSDHIVDHVVSKAGPLDPKAKLAEVTAHQVMDVLETTEMEKAVFENVAALEKSSVVKYVQRWWKERSALFKTIVMHSNLPEPFTMTLQTMVKMGLLPHPEHLIVSADNFKGKATKIALAAVGTFFGQPEVLPLIPLISGFMNRGNSYFAKMRAYLEQNRAVAGQLSMFNYDVVPVEDVHAANDAVAA